MKWITFIPLLAASIFLTHSSSADVAPYEAKEVSQHSFTSPDGTAALDVSIKRFDRTKIRQVNIGRDKAPEAWLGEKKLPTDILWRNPTMISAFSLKIDDQRINIPERFWNDLVGLNLEKVVINKKPTNPEETWELQQFTDELWNPKVSRSRDGSTVLITWIRPEE